MGLSTLSVPSRSEATNSDPCGRVYLVNADNELLKLQRSAQILAREGDIDRDLNRRLAIRSRAPITGLADGERLIGVDVRPSNGLLYGVGRLGDDPMSPGQLYTIDVDSGLAAAGRHAAALDPAERRRRSASTSTRSPTSCAS